MAGGGRMAKWIECIQHIPSFHETTHYPMVLSQFFFFCLPAKLVTARDEAILLSPLWLALYLPFFVKSSQQPLSTIRQAFSCWSLDQYSMLKGKKLLVSCSSPGLFGV